MTLRIIRISESVKKNPLLARVRLDEWLYVQREGVVKIILLFG